jgi:SAM-dependent methyltransferase
LDILLKCACSIVPLNSRPLPPNSPPVVALSSILADSSCERAAEIYPSPPPRLDFSQRAQLTEWMDEPCTYAELRDCLHDIARVNSLSLAHWPTISWLDELVASRPLTDRPLRIVDVGCGYGDMLRRVSRWATKRGISVALTGIDLNPNAIRAAREATSSKLEIDWVVGDALAHPIGETDVVLSALLTHHLPDAEIVRFLSWMEATCRLGWFINDLHRKPIPYHFFRFWARFWKLHRFVRHDGPVSIRRSFVPQDWDDLCVAAEIPASSFSVREFRPARLCVGRIKV